MNDIIMKGYEDLGIVQTKSVSFTFIAILAANLGLYIYKRLRGKAAEGDNTVAGIFFGTVSVLYSLILAFVIMAEWDDFNSLNQTIAAEADKLNNILSHSANLPDTIRATIGNSLSVYCQQVINDEWTTQELKVVDHPSAIPALRSMLLTTTPANSQQENVLKVLDDDLSSISDLRRDRLSHTHSQLPSLVWGILDSGALMLVLFCYFFQVSSEKLHRFYLSFFVCLLAMCLSIIYNLDHPFSPGSGVNNSPYKKVLSELPAYYRPLNKIAYLSYSGDN